MIILQLVISHKMFWTVLLIVAALCLCSLYSRTNTEAIEQRMSSIHTQCINSSSVFVMIPTTSNDIAGQISALFEHAQCPYSVYVACLEYNGSALREALSRRLVSRNQPEELVANVRTCGQRRNETALKTLWSLYRNESSVIVLNGDQTATMVHWDTFVTSALTAQHPSPVLSWHAPYRGTVAHNMHFCPMQCSANQCLGKLVAFAKRANSIPMAFATFDVFASTPDIMKSVITTFPNDMDLTELLHSARIPIVATSIPYIRRSSVSHAQTQNKLYAVSETLQKYMTHHAVWNWVRMYGLTPDASDIEVWAKHGTLEHVQLKFST